MLLVLQRRKFSALKTRPVSSSKDSRVGIQGVKVSQRLMRRCAATERAAYSSTVGEIFMEDPLSAVGGLSGVNDGLGDCDVLSGDPREVNDGDVTF